MGKRKDSDALNSHTETPGKEPDKWSRPLTTTVKRRRVSNPSPPDTIQSHASPIYRTQGTQTIKELSPADSGERKSQDTSLSSEDRVLEWAENLPSLEEMSNGPNKRPRGSSGSSPSNWDIRNLINARNAMERCGIYAQEKEELEIECPYLQGNLKPGPLLPYLERNLNRLIQHTGNKTEGDVQREILPWTVPRPISLDLSGIWNGNIASFEDNIMYTPWSHSKSMGSSEPKPDYVAGLSQKAFTNEEYTNLQAVHDLGMPMSVSPGVFMPFLICEAKSGTEGLVQAEIQNLHAGAILIRSMLDLHEAAGMDLPNGEILAWSIDMNHEFVHIYGHYAQLENEEIRFYRHRIKGVQLREPADRFVPYNFVRNLYEKFVPEVHLARIQKALAQIQDNRKNNIPIKRRAGLEEPPDKLPTRAAVKQQLNKALQDITRLSKTEEEQSSQIQELLKKVKELENRVAGPSPMLE